MKWLMWLFRTRDIARGILDDEDTQTRAELERQERERVARYQHDVQQRIQSLEALVEAQHRHKP